MSMRKSNRKGYFVRQLRREGVDDEVLAANPPQKGIRKQPKIAAKEARERKKIYIQHMEQKITESEIQISRLKEENAKMFNENQELKRLLNIKEPTKKQALKIDEQQPSQLKTNRFQGLFKQIGNLSVNLQNGNREEVVRSLSILRDKYGVSGRERLKYIDQEFDKLVGIMMPMHYRLLMEHSTNNRQFLSLLGSEYENKNLMKMFNKQKEILINMRPQIVKQKEEYDKIINQMYEMKTKIKAQNFKCQYIVDQIQDRVDPIFVGRLLLDLDFCRFRGNLDATYPINFWNKVKEEGIDYVVPQKKNSESGIHTEQKENLFNFDEDLEIFNQLFS